VNEKRKREKVEKESKRRGSEWIRGKKR